MIGSEANGESAAAGDQGSSGMAHRDANCKAERDRRDADQRKPEVEVREVEGIEIGKEVWLRSN